MFKERDKINKNETENADMKRSGPAAVWSTVVHGTCEENTFRFSV